MITIKLLDLDLSVNYDPTINLSLLEISVFTKSRALLGILYYKDELIDIEILFTRWRIKLKNYRPEHWTH